MIDAVNVCDWETVIAFGVWTLVIYTAGWAVFRSFVAGELRHRLYVRDSKHILRVHQLQWELKNKVHFSKELARGDSMAAKVPLTNLETTEKTNELQVLQRITLWQRALRYLMTCVTCQSFCTSLVMFVLIEHRLAIVSSLAYAGACNLLHREGKPNARPALGTPPRPGEGGCGSR